MKSNFNRAKGKRCRCGNLFLLNILSIFMLGCSGHTWVSSTKYYPPGTDHKSAQYKIYIEVHGEKRHAYTDKTLKKVYLSIWKAEKKIFSREYVCTAASLEWDVAWDKLDDLKIIFFDFSEGVSIYDKDALGLPAKQIFALRFTFDNQSKKFIEYPVSSNVVKNVKEK